MSFDERIVPARKDIAADFLKNKHKSQKFVSGIKKEVIFPKTNLYSINDTKAPLATELLLGEEFVVYENKAGWSWGQSLRDSYVGYVRSESLSTYNKNKYHIVSNIFAPVYEEPKTRSRVMMKLCMNSKISISKSRKNFLLSNVGWILDEHIKKDDAFEKDFVEIATKFINTPYLWGGKSYSGIDCSGLVQLSLQRFGILSPRDSDQQERNLGKNIGKVAENLERGDLVFWKGHVAIVVDSNSIIHANSFHKKVTLESTQEAIERLKAKSIFISSIKRI